jgi:hypothetical protein
MRTGKVKDKGISPQTIPTLETGTTGGRDTHVTTAAGPFFEARS